MRTLTYAINVIADVVAAALFTLAVFLVLSAIYSFALLEFAWAWGQIIRVFYGVMFFLFLHANMRDTRKRGNTYTKMVLGWDR